LIRTTDKQLARFNRGLKGGQPDEPLSSLIASRLMTLSSKLDGYLFAGCGPTPDGDWPFALQHHVIAKYFSQSDFGGQFND
jgi:hypothetical protein